MTEEAGGGGEAGDWEYKENKGNTVTSEVDNVDSLRGICWLTTYMQEHYGDTARDTGKQ